MRLLMSVDYLLAALVAQQSECTVRRCSVLLLPLALLPELTQLHKRWTNYSNTLAHKLTY
jgi:hypothetical protein